MMWGLIRKCYKGGELEALMEFGVDRSGMEVDGSR